MHYPVSAALYNLLKFVPIYAFVALRNMAEFLHTLGNKRGFRDNLVTRMLDTYTEVSEISVYFYISGYLHEIL